MKEIGQCQLCLHEKPLAESHIIPEFLYKPLYDEKGRAHQFTGGQSQTHKIIQKGIRERLLCRGKDSCEELLGKWERYASQLYYYILIKGSDYSDAKVVTGIDYTKFKLFQMSILWRASVSAQPEFNKVKLGPHQERLRKMLLEGNPREPYDFGCVMMIRQPWIQGFEELIISPDVNRIKGHNVITFIINGVIWQFYVSSHTARLPIVRYFLTREGELPFVVLPEAKYDKLILRATKGILH